MHNLMSMLTETWYRMMSRLKEQTDENLLVTLRNAEDK